MPSDPLLPSQVERQERDEIHRTSSQIDTSDTDKTNETNEPFAPEGERPPVSFSSAHWLSTGIVRLLYRLWTRIAANVFPEDSKSEQLARVLHIPLPDRLNMSWVTDRLAVGGRVRPEDIKALGRVGITDVIDTRSEYRDDEQALAREGIQLLYLPTPDTHPLSVEQLMQGAEWASKRIRQGRRVLIHCEHGVGRSVLLTCAVLVYNGMHARDALRLVQQKRWQAAPNQRQVSRLKEFESALAIRRKA
jgi:protein tyrosine phosphatase (PTP) superfamily phosphohydrolase (DUF442 family)